MELFPSPDEMGVVPVLFMLCVYGYILFLASGTIAEGSEMLLLLYGPGIIGGLIIPILGAVPDCMIILLSGMGGGTKDEIQSQLSVGVGTLVGSTVMLLTVPWGVAVFLGQRTYDPKTGEAGIGPDKKPLLKKPFHLTENCITVKKDIPATGRLMVLASLSYWVIQIPAFFYHKDSDHGELHESPFALVGFIVTLAGFCGYCYLQFSSAQVEEEDRLREVILRRDAWKTGLNHKISRHEYQRIIFDKFDRDASGFLDMSEFADALQYLGLKLERRDLQNIITQIDKDNNTPDGKVSFNEFQHACNAWVKEGKATVGADGKPSLKPQPSVFNRAGSLTKAPAATGDVSVNVAKKDEAKKDYGAVADGNASVALLDHTKAGDEKHGEGGEGDDEDDCEEEEEQYFHLSERQLLGKALLLLLAGTGVVTIFSDPMVDVISAFGEKIGVSPFYISFVVTPLASNASEVLSGLIFAKKKTKDGLSLCLSSLHGAATMNHTLSLCIFMSLVYFRELSWSFSAEVLTTVIVTAIVAYQARKTNIFVWQGLLVLSLYPLSILFVFILENVVGLD